MSKRIKILQTIRQAHFGGGETHLKNLVLNLDHEKFESVILTFKKGSLYDEFRESGLSTYCFETNIPFNLTLINRINDIIKNEEIDIVHAHGTRGASNSILNALFNNIPFVYTVHGWSFHSELSILNYFIRKNIERFICKSAAKVICVSNANLKQASFIKPSKRALIYNGVDTNIFKQLDKKEIRENYGLAERDFVIGFLVRLNYQKNPLTVLKACKILMNKYDNVKILIAGEGELKDEVDSFIKNENIGGRVIHFPFRKDVVEMLNAIDLYLLPSFWEGLPYGLIEAMAVKIPAVASNVDGIPEVIQNYFNGILVQPNDVEQIADATEKLMIDNELYSKLSKNARDTIVEKFSLSKMVSETEKIYEELISNKKN